MKKRFQSELVTDVNDQIISTGRILSFYLRREAYAIVSLNVQKLISSMYIVLIPNTPEHICGVIEAPQKILSIIHLRRSFGLPVLDNTEEPWILIFPQGTLAIGISKGRVTIVIAIPQHRIERVPSYDIVGNSEYLTGIDK